MTEQVMFLGRAERLIDTSESVAVSRVTRQLTRLRDLAFDELDIGDQLRDRARNIRLESLSHLDRHLSRFTDEATAAGCTVHFAGDATEANEIVADILKEASVVAKSKSMVSEEIELNHHLESRGVRVVETDLGEYISQMAGDTPSHIIAPVLHMTKEQVGDLFADHLGVEYSDDPIRLNRYARESLRPVFLEADAGISGVNMAVAETGSIVLVTNEGNGRLVTTAPRIHVALMGMERIVPTWDQAAVILETLARSATGQRLSVYTNVITGPRRAEDPDGPEEVHIVVIDNGRSAVLGGATAEILACIRCGACLNVCPVFRSVGGHAYGTVYSGPVGAVLTPGLLGADPWWDLPYASTLCGACEEVCPVRIQIPSMLLKLREEAVSEGRLPGWLNRGMRIYSSASTDPGRWARLKRRARLLMAPFSARGWVRRLPGPARGWTQHRDLPRPPRDSFTDWWKADRGA